MPRKSMNHLIGWLEHVAKHWKLALLLVAVLLIFSIESPPQASMEARVNRELVHLRFNFVGWEISTVWQKLEHGLVSPQHYVAEEDRHDFLLDYLDLVAQTHRLEGEIHTVYVDPEIDDAHEATAELRARCDELRQAITARQSTAEAILEEQVASVLEEEGFAILGQELPPVAVHFTPLPRFLIISPRDRIETVHQLSLTHGLGVREQEKIEEQVDAAFDVSSLVTAIGGLSAYPSMVLESSSINWITEVIAHEWTHHYLAARPLGRKYSASGETRRINETVASIVGKEVGRKVVARYYPEYLPTEPEPTPQPKDPEEQDEQDKNEQLQPATFDFRLEMRETRIRVDELLGQGRMEEAETYMEQRRTIFVEHGYAIRKLNQAYFAFHGAYAAEPGAAGEDPIGPAVQELFARAPDLQTFLNRIASVTTLSELDTLLDELEPPNAS